MLAMLFVLVGYLLGSLPAGYFVSLWRGVKIQEVGSHSAGATNVARILGWRYGIPVVLADMTKSALLIVAVGWITNSAWIQVATLGAVMLGSAFPVFLRFKGGKGAATLAGGLVVLLPLFVVFAFLFVWISTLAITKRMSTTNLVLAIILMFFLLFFAAPIALKLLGVGAALFLAYSHRENIRRILKREESSLPLRF